MSGNDWSDVFDGDHREQQETGSGLRKQLEQLLEQNKKLSERLDRAERKETLDALLKDKGMDPAVAEIIPDGKDPGEWLSQYGSLLRTNLDQTAPQQTPDVVVTPTFAAEQTAMAQMQPSGDATGSTTSGQDPYQQLAGLKTEQEMLNFLNQFKSGGEVTGTGMFS